MCGVVMSKKYYHSYKSLLDILFLTAAGFVFLFFIAFMMIEPESNETQIRTKAEYVITTTWEHDSPDDVDVWLRDPTGNLLYFKKKEIGLMHLDRDDLGDANDSYILSDGTVITYNYNQEIVTIRGIIPGEWVLNIHMYSKKTKKPTKVLVRMDKINPSVKTMVNQTYTMEKKWDQITVLRFTLNSKGDIISRSKLPIDLVVEDYTLGYRGGGQARSGSVRRASGGGGL